jgi:hypothetical protein
MRDEYLIADKYAGFLRAVDRLVGKDARLHLQVSYDFLSAWRDGLTPSEAARESILALETAAQKIIDADTARRKRRPPSCVYF